MQVLTLGSRGAPAGLHRAAGEVVDDRQRRRGSVWSGREASERRAAGAALGSFNDGNLEGFLDCACAEAGTWRRQKLKEGQAVQGVDSLYESRRACQGSTLLSLLLAKQARCRG